MAKRYCAGCGQPIAQGFRICPNCGKVPEAEKPDFRAGKASGKQPIRNGGAARPPQNRQTAGYGERYTYEPPRRPNGTQRAANAGAGRQQRRPESVIGTYGSERPPRQTAQPYPERQRGGDIYAERQRRAESYSRSSYGYEQPDLPKRNMPKRKPQPKPQRPTAKGKARSGFSKFIDTSSKIVKAVVNTIKIAVLLAVIYGCVFLIQVYRVKLTPYPYSTTMRMSRNNYGQAISGYFGSGHWIVNPFTLKCSYKGETLHSEQMELVFSAGLSVELSEITIDGQPLDKRYFESKIMGMFI